MVFRYPAKSGVRRVQGVIDEQACDVVAALKRRRGGGPSCSPTRRAAAGTTSARRTSTRTSRRRRAGTSPPRTSAPGTRRCWPPSRSPWPARRRATRTGAQARRQPRGQGGRGLPRQHARRLPRLLHRPARVRRLSRRGSRSAGARARRRADRARRAADPPARARGGGARPAQRARGLDGAGAGRSLTRARAGRAGSSRRIDGPAVIAVHDDGDEHGGDARPHQHALVVRARARPRPAITAR